jgi:glycosyltransferase involved in cell wall biosynthesis
MVGGSDVLLLARNRRRRRCIQNVLQRADAVVALSNDLGTKVADLGISPEKIHVLRRGVDTALFSPGDSDESRRHLGLANHKSILLFVGRMVQVKGLDTLLDACDRLRQHNRDFLLCLIGDGPLRQQLAADVDRRGLSPHVRFVGSVPHSELVHWYRAADLTVLASRSEGIPNVLLESLACGTPFVATAVGGIPEIARHDAARLVPPDCPEPLAAAIDTLLNERPNVLSCQRPYGLHDFADAVVELIHRVRLQTQSETRRPGLTCAQQPPASSRRSRPGRFVFESNSCLRQVSQADIPGLARWSPRRGGFSQPEGCTPAEESNRLRHRRSLSAEERRPENG